MKISPDSNFHLTYCTNIHPGERWQEVFANLKQYTPVLKSRLSPHAPFGIGLRLADVAARELLQGNNLAEFQAWLTQHDLYVFTLNGFPYGEFHRLRVKDHVYAPDWSTQARLDYTLRLVQLLAELLPVGMDGGISTSPLSYKPWLKQLDARTLVLQRSSLHLAKITAEMVQIQQKTGKVLHVDLEPEPDGLIENALEVIDFFQAWLLPIGVTYLSQRLGISYKRANAYLLNHIRVCYDTCHFAVEYEDPVSVLAQFQAAGIQIGKIQLSAALQVPFPEQAQDRAKVVGRLRQFAESTYLHQVVERQTDGTLHHYPDLATALPDFEQANAQEWRTHFHVPIFIRDYQVLQSTQADIVAVLDLLQQQPVCQHLEIETYTWEVLPLALKQDLLDSISREYEWVLDAFEPRRLRNCNLLALKGTRSA